MKHSLGARRGRERRERRDLRRGRRGFSFIELMVALGVLSIVLLAFSATVASSTTVRSLAEERRIAEQQLSSYLEQLRTQPISGLTNTTTTPSVPGLVNVTQTLTVYRDETGPGSTNVDHDGLSFPVDINGDGDATDTVAAADCLILPSRLTLTWTSASQQTQELRLYVYLSSF